MRHAHLMLATVVASMAAAAPLGAQWLERVTLSVGWTAANDLPPFETSDAHALVTADVFGRPESRLVLRLDGLVEQRAGVVTTANVIARAPWRSLSPYALAGAGVLLVSDMAFALQGGVGLERPVRNRRMFVEGRMLHAEETLFSVGLGVRL